MARPRTSRLPRRLKRLWDRETAARASAPAKAEKMIVFLWVIREEMRPDPMTARKYPVVVIRNKVPACAWEMERSASMAGSRGAMMILPVKLRKKTEARRRIGPIRERKLEPDSVGTVGGLFKSNSSH